MTVADDLRAGATYIREHGHAKRTAEAADGSVCAVGGIARGIGTRIEICYGSVCVTPDESRRFGDAVVALDNYLRATGMSVCMSVTRWSDITFEGDVITSMEKAAAWVEEKA